MGEVSFLPPALRGRFPLLSRPRAASENGSMATDLDYFHENFDSLPPHLQSAVREKLLRLTGGDPAREARERFLPFVRRVWPGFVHGRHHDVMADAFERIEKGELKRCIINMPPRSTKSRFTSVLFPAWFLGRHPGKKIFEGSHTASLAMDFGKDLRNLVASEPYQEIFPGVKLAQDSRAAHRWSTRQGGEYFAVGKTGGAAGRGGDLVILDDPHSEQDVLKNAKAEFEKTWKWYLAGPRQRLQPGAAILVVMTRWGEMDLTGRLIQQYAEEEEELERWEVIELPAILPSGDPLFPEFWKIQELLATRATLPPARWQANYQQMAALVESGHREVFTIVERAFSARCGYSSEMGRRGRSVKGSKQKGRAGPLTSVI